MGRQEQPLDPEQGPVVRFAHDLRDLRRRAGSPSYRQLAARTHFSASTLASAAAGQRLPSAAVLAAFVNACGGDPEEWEQRRIHTHVLSTSPPSVSSPSTPNAQVETRDSPQQSKSRWRVLRKLAGPAAALATAVVMLGVFASGDSVPSKGAQAADRLPDMPAAMVEVRLRDDGRWLRTDAGIPRQYRHLIVEAGTMCDVPQVTPALVAAILEAESEFDPLLSDPAKDEYGIARWTPRVLRYYLPPAKQKAIPKPPFSPEDSIPAVGRMLCAIAPELESIPGDRALNLAAGYRISTWRVQLQGAELRSIQPYLNRVRANLDRYQPASDSSHGLAGR
ncbi:helix-turn-helix domain-containing protein [Streptomyces sp. W1SF4]|uniref:helix-turn-helix domain-containing protein n=1 Tax=Streptomyces sp. W1SF4 TaxID=2305220 RepID=UPI001F49AFC6|nr:helix-turn-helix domain-containing protein [Streptomyces sp. W1SF4]